MRPRGFKSRPRRHSWCNKLVRIRGLRVIREFDPWGSPLCTCPHKFTLNPYTGCGHHCLYCYARSYIRDFDKPRPKNRLLINLLHDLDRLPKNALISMSESSDPYTPPEHRLRLTRKALSLIISKRFRVLIITKSDLVTRDADVLSKGRVAVAITITTVDDSLARKLEPGAPSPTNRIEAIRRLSKSGIPVIVRLDPVIPFINDDPLDVEELISEVAKAGVIQISSSTYKARLDSLKRLCSAFPSLKDKLIDLYLIRGVKISGYYYLPYEVRLKYMLMVKEISEKYGLAFTTCREGFKFLNTPGIYCDGSTYTYI